MEKINAFIQATLAKLLDDTLSDKDLTVLTLKTGKFGVNGMALLDKANTETYGNPEITKVNLGVKKNPAILISGHDFKDFEQLLEQTEGTGVDVYTHGETLPAITTRSSKNLRTSSTITAMLGTFRLPSLKNSTAQF